MDKKSQMQISQLYTCLQVAAVMPTTSNEAQSWMEKQMIYQDG